MVRATVTVFCLVVVALTAFACSRPRPDVERFHSSARVDTADFPDAHAAVLLDRHEVTFLMPPGAALPVAEVVRTRRMQILDEKGLDAATVLIPFDARAQLLAIDARVLKPDGTIKQTPPDVSVEVSRFKSTDPAAKLYNGPGWKKTAVLGAEVGDVVELVTLSRVRDPRWLPPVVVGGDLPFVRGEVVIDYPTGFDVDFRVTKLGDPITVRPNKLPQRVRGRTLSSLGVRSDDGESVSGTRLSFVFEREPAIFPEGNAPDREALSTQLHVHLRSWAAGTVEGNGFRSLDDVAAWYRELTAGMDKPDRVTRELASGMNKGQKLAKVKEVQRYLQDEIGDVDTFLHLAALPVHSAVEVHRARFGDAKDQASLGLAILRALELDAFPVLVSRTGSYAAVPDLPTPAPFNHVILALPQGGTYAFIDPSTPFLPTGRLAGPLQGQRGVLVRSDGASLIDLPADADADNARDVELDLQIDEAGRVTGSVRATLSGLDSAAARTLVRQGGPAAREGLRRLLLGDVEGPDAPQGLTFEDALVVGGKRTTADDTFKVQIPIAPLQLKIDRGLAVVVEELVGRPFAFLWRTGRKAPIELDHAYTERLKLTLKLPEGMGINDLPPPYTKAGTVLSVDERWAMADGSLWFSRKLALEQKTLAAERLDELQGPVRALWARQQQRLAIVPGGERGKDYSGDPF